MQGMRATLLIGAALLAAAGYAIATSTGARPFIITRTDWAAPHAPSTMADTQAPIGDSAQRVRTAATQERDDQPHDAASVDGAAVVLRGRCVRSEDGAPLAECTVAVRRAPARAAPPEWPALDTPAAIKTAADGVFELAITLAHPYDDVALRITAAGRTPREGNWPRPAPGRTIDVGDVPMHRAVRVRGTLVDESGAVVADAGVLFAMIDLTGTQRTVVAEDMLRARTDARGAFAFAAPAYAGEWYVGVEESGALVEPRSVKLNGDEESLPLRIVVQRPDPRFTIRGRVVDESGRPLADVGVSANGDGYVGRGRSDADGMFAIHRAGPSHNDGVAGARLHTSVRGGLFERVAPDPETRVAWGTGDVELVLRRKPDLDFTVRDARGRPVADYALFGLRRGREGWVRTVGQARRGGHADGRCTIEGMTPGTCGVLVVPADRRLALAGPVEFEVNPAQPHAEISVTVPDAVPLEVVVQDPAGRPMEGSAVELICALDRAAPTAGGALPAVGDADVPRRTPSHLVIAQAMTPADGRVHFSAPPGSWWLRAQGTTHLGRVQAVEVGIAATVQRITVESAAAVDGQLEPLEAVTTLRDLASRGREPVAVLITPSQDEDAKPRTAEVDASGHFELGGLGAGAHDFSLRYWLETSPVHADSVVLPLGTETLVPGEPRALQWSIDALLPATVEGRVWINGEPLRDVHCFVRHLAPGEPTSLRIATDGEGAFRATVPAGNYGFSVTLAADPGPGWLHLQLPDRFSVAAGESRSVDVRATVRAMRVRLLAPDETPLPDLQVKLDRKDFYIPGSLRTDADGWLTLKRAPWDAFFVSAEVDGERRRFGPIDLPREQHTGEVVVRGDW